MTVTEIEMMTKSINEIEKKTAKDLATARKENEQKEVQCYNDIIKFLADVIKNNPRVRHPSHATVEVNTGRRNLEIYTLNCHSWKDWKGCAITDMTCRHQSYPSGTLRKDIVEYWPYYKEAILKAFYDNQEKYVMTVKTDLEAELGSANALANFEL